MGVSRCSLSIFLHDLQIIEGFKLMQLINIGCLKKLLYGNSVQRRTKDARKEFKPSSPLRCRPDSCQFAEPSPYASLVPQASARLFLFVQKVLSFCSKKESVLYLKIGKRYNSKI